jgi:hypothetical protein
MVLSSACFTVELRWESFLASLLEFSSLRIPWAMSFQEKVLRSRENVITARLLDKTEVLLILYKRKQQR